MGGSSKAPEVSEPEKQTLETAEIPIQDPINQQNGPPRQTDAAAFEPMDTEVSSVASHDPPSPKPPSPAMSTDKSPAATNVDYITAIRSAFKVHEVSRVLNKHSTKEEIPSWEKGKAKLDLESYSSFDAGEVYTGYLSTTKENPISSAGSRATDMAIKLKLSSSACWHALLLYLLSSSAYPNNSYC